MTISQTDQQNLLDKGYMRVATIIEILGAPKEHVVETLYQYVEKLKSEKNIKVIQEDYSKPKEQDKLYSMFVEMDILVKDASTLAYFCFDYMPSSIEVIEPEEFKYNAADFSSFFNELQARLHKVDRVVKELAANNKNLIRNTNMLLRNCVIILLDNVESGKMPLGDLSRRTGIPETQLLSFLNEMVKDQWLLVQDGLYRLAKKAINPDTSDCLLVEKETKKQSKVKHSA